MIVAHSDKDLVVFIWVREQSTDYIRHPRSLHDIDMPS